MQGIYKIKNKINNKIYIGQSKNIIQRWEQHKRNLSPSCTKLNNAFKKYGIENFEFSIIEEISNSELLTTREQYWIEYYDSIKNGYNILNATNTMSGESNLNSKLKLKDVNEIIELLKNTEISFKQIGKLYNVNVTTISRINSGDTWFNENIVYPIRSKDKYFHEFANYGEKSPLSKLTDEEVMNIRMRYVNEEVKEIHKDYPQYSLSGFKKVVQGPSYPHLPIYKKRNKFWQYPINL